MAQSTLAFPSSMSTGDMMSAAEKKWGTLDGVVRSRVGDKVYLFPQGTTPEQVSKVTGGTTVAPPTPDVAPTVEGEPTAVGGGTWGETLASAAKRFMPSVGEVLKETAEGAKTLITHPVETGKAMLGIVSDLNKRVVKTAMEDPLHADRMSDEELSDLQAITADLDEQLAGGASEMLGGYMYENYGSVEGFKAHLAENPAVVMSDLSTALMGAGVATKTAKLAKIAGYADPVTLAAQSVKLPLRAIQLSGAPSRIYNSAIKFTNKLSVDDTRRLEQLGMEDWITPNMKGLRKVNDKINIVNQEIGSLIDRATATGEKIQVDRLFDDFDDLKQTHLAESGEGLKAKKAIEEIEQEIRGANKELGREALSAQEAQRLKVKIYKDLKTYYQREGSVPAGKEAQQMVAKQAREFIEALTPEIKDVNALHSDYKKLWAEVEDAAKKVEKTDLLPFSTAVKATAGAAIGGKLFGAAGATTGGALGFTLGFIDSNPTIKANLAIILDKATKLGIETPTPPALANLASFRMGEYVEQETENTGEE